MRLVIISLIASSLLSATLPVSDIKVSGLTGVNLQANQATWGVDIEFDTLLLPPMITASYYRTSGSTVTNQGNTDFTTTESQVGLRWRYPIAIGSIVYGSGVSTIQSRVTQAPGPNLTADALGVYTQIGLITRPQNNWSFGVMATYSSAQQVLDKYTESGGLYLMSSLGIYF